MTSSDPRLLVGLGITAALLGSAGGAAGGSGAAASYLMNVYHHRGLTTPRQTLFALCPIIIAGVLAIYGLIIAILIHGKTSKVDMVDALTGFRCLTAGLAVGVATFTSGMGIAYFMSNCCQLKEGVAARRSEQAEPLVPGSGQAAASMKPVEPNIFMLVSLVFLEAIGLYGLITALFLVGSILDKN